MDHLRAIRSFIEIADQGSLTRAAETLNLSRAMISRHLEALERWLGARLLHRTTRSVSLSEAGMQALPRLRQMVEMADELQAVAGAHRTEPAGKLRITTSLSFAVSCLAQAVVDFQARHPRIEIELLTVDRAVDLVAERIDLAVRITNRLDDGVVARRLASCRSVLCASPAYLKQHGRPERPEELEKHRCITSTFGARAEYRLRRAGRVTTHLVKGSLSSNETAVLRQAALSGAGIAMLPSYYVRDDLAQGALVRLLPDHEPEPLGIHAVYLSRQHQPQPLKLLIDFLAERFGGDIAPWDRQQQPAGTFMLEVAPSKIDGQGVFAGTPIPPRRKIGELRGELIDIDTARIRATRHERIMIVELSPQHAMDFRKSSDPLRFTNHSCQPNARFRIRPDRVEFYALRAIAAGEELTVRYGDTHHEGQRPCRCGAPTCVGRL
jgi:DNA-binding transcriptional LysR family regulator